jgi:tetratricopeptide (TPR) repeat protein
MKTAHVIREMQQTQKNGETALRQGDNQGAVECYQKALRILGQLPPDTEFDRRKFGAAIYAGLSAALGKLDKHTESFAAANKALTYYDALSDVPVEEVGRFLMAQVNQGTALAALGCLPAALEALQRAKDVFRIKGLDTGTNRQWLDQVDGNIEAIQRQIEKKRQQG